MSKRNRHRAGVQASRASSGCTESASCCASSVSSLPKGLTLAALVRDYEKRYRPCRRRQLRFYRSLPSLHEAITKAAMAERDDGKRHAHQRRIRWAVLRKVKDALLKRAKELSAARNLDQMLGIVKDSAVPGFGALAAYDTALRIGVWLRKRPNRVYLHAGVAVGARALSLNGPGGYLRRHELPGQFARLDAGEVEDFLCIYKDELSVTPRARIGGHHE